MEIIEQIGSYAGLAAIVGLAVLSALYFSQARDLRRLREGEEGRVAEPAVAEDAQARGPKRPTAAVVPGPGEPAGAAEKGGEPAAAGDESNGKDEKRAAPAGSGPAAPAGSGPAAPAGSAAVAASNAGGPRAAPAETQVGAAPVERGNAGRPPPRPTPPRLPPPRPGAAAAAMRSASSSSTASPPATAASERPWYRALPPRYMALIVAGIVVVSAGAVYAFAALIGEGEAGSSADVASEDSGSSGDTAPLDPSTITVAVLNGTDVAGLAGQIADSVEAAGFQRGNVSNAPEQGGTAESAVLFADGAERAARQVGQELGISQIEPIDEQSRALAGTADVVVIVGADRAD